MNEKDIEIKEEKVCQNCQNPVTGNFCAECGQKTNVHKDSFWHMIAHFVGDYFHYDSKLWVTLKTLLFQPGKITVEYNQGKRAKYLNPIQLYIFITTVFFIFYFSFSKSEKDQHPKTKASLTTLSDTIQQNIEKNKKIEFDNEGINFSYNGDSTNINFESLAAYDSIQNTLEPSKRDNWLERYGRKKLWLLDKKYPNSNDLNNSLLEKMLHNTPKVFFLLLPYFALLLMFVFKKRKIFYIDHLVFSLHFHSAMFIIFGTVSTLNYLFSYFDFEKLMNIIFISVGSIYLFKALKKVYPNKLPYILLQQFFLFSMYFIGFVIALIVLLALSFLML